MTGFMSEEAGVARSMEEIPNDQRCQSSEALVEWRSSEQVENGIPSTSPPYWDTDDDDDGGPKPSELYGKYTWKIEKFSQISKRELRSSAFEIGGYKWYILIYPQGCDVCNHLSLFLCVANHDKLLPGWSHFAQFTIAVVNKDPKKSKHSDTLHKFWKKEHDWGWKKFMELSKVSDGFLDATDTLIIKAQVQVIRERADQPFRCLDCQYRRELIRVYLTTVENTCRRFVEERQGKLGRLIEDKNRWSSFCSFWLGMDQNSRRHMSREKTDVILKVVVKHFFIEKEVTSTLVMDSLYSGLKALKGQTKSKKGKVKLLDAEEMPAPIISVENDMFVLVDDVLLLIERAAMKPLPPKDDKGPQNRTKDGNTGEDFNKDAIEHDERRLTELGRRTVEIFALAHIFNHNIEVAYQEAVALKRQEELIREEEEAWLAESEQKAKRGASEKEKKSKKKQAKLKRNNRKGKDKGREERCGVEEVDRVEEENPNRGKMNSIVEVQLAVEKCDILEDASDVSDSVDGVTEVLQPDSEERDTSLVNWDTDNSEVHLPTEASSSGVNGFSSIPNGIAEKRSSSAMDDSSSTCSSDTIPSVVMNGPNMGSFYTNHQYEKSPSRGKNRVKMTCDGGSTTETDNQPSWTAVGASNLSDANGRSKAGQCQSESVVDNLQDGITWGEQHVDKEEDVLSPQKRSSTKELVDMERPKEKMTAASSSPCSPPKSPPKDLSSTVQLKTENKISAATYPVQVKKVSSNSLQQADKVTPLTLSPQDTAIPKPETQNASTPKLSEKPVPPQVPMMSRLSSAPPMLCWRPTPSVASMVQTTSPLTRSVSATDQLGPGPSAATHNYVTQSYRNSIMGNSVRSNTSGFTRVNLSSSHAQPPTLVSAPMFLPQSSDRLDQNSVQSVFPFPMVSRDALQNGSRWTENSERDANRSMHGEPSTLINGVKNRSMHYEPSSLVKDFQNLDLYKPVNSRSREHFSAEFPPCTSGRLAPGVVTDEFPHLDIINDLLDVDDEYCIGMVSGASKIFQSHSSGPHILNRHFSFPCDVGVSLDSGSSTSSSCRFERTRSYHDVGFEQDYSLSPAHFDTRSEFVPQANTLSYSNGHINGLIPNHWQMMAGSELPLVGMTSADADASSYFSPEYSNLASGGNGYTMFRPSNGH